MREMREMMKGVILQKWDLVKQIDKVEWALMREEENLKCCYKLD